MNASLDARAAVRAALLLERAGRAAEAEAAYEALLARWPALPDSWYNLGVLQRRARRYDAALASYQQALDRGITRPEEVHLNRGVIFADHLRDDAAALRELRAALKLNPAFAPAWFNLANLHEDLGQRDDAMAAYEKVLALEPRNHEALARYASLRGMAGPADPLAGRLRAALADPAAAPADKASVAFALGKALDGCGAYDDAFAAYAAANRHSRAGAARPGALYDRDAHERFVDALIAAFTPDAFPAAPRASDTAPIFVCGMFRSGSTLTEQVLAGHPQIRAGGEIDFLPTLVQSELAPFPESLARTSPQQLADMARRYRELTARLFPGAAHVTDKRPDNFLYLGLVKRLFPEARIVHTTRHPLDNCLSIYFLHLDHGMGYALDLADIGHYYAQYRRLMAHWKSLFGADILDFDYDAFVREPRPAVARLLAFCGLDWNESCLDFQTVDRAVKTASVWQVREPLYQRSSGRWRHYARQLAPLRAELHAAGLLPDGE